MTCVIGTFISLLASFGAIIGIVLFILFGLFLLGYMAKEVAQDLE